MVTVKEYAKAHGKSVQAVYQQMKARENAPLLEGHIITEKVNNKPTKFLDDVAVEILERASMQSPSIVMQAEQSERLEQLQNDKELLLVRVAELQDGLLKKQELITELTGSNTLLLEEKKQQTELDVRRKERIRELKAENKDIRNQLQEQTKLADSRGKLNLVLLLLLFLAVIAILALSVI